MLLLQNTFRSKIFKTYWRYFEVSVKWDNFSVRLSFCLHFLTETRQWKFTHVPHFELLHCIFNCKSVILFFWPMSFFDVFLFVCFTQRKKKKDNFLYAGGIIPGTLLSSFWKVIVEFFPNARIFHSLDSLANRFYM